MTAPPDTLSVASTSTRTCSEDGSTLVETVLAASLTLVAVGMLVGNVLVPLATLEERLTPDGRVGELHAAADGFARIVRAARSSSAGGPVIRSGSHELVLTVGPDGAELAASIVDGALLVSPSDVTSGGAPLPAGRLVHGIDVAQSAFEILGAGAADVADPRDAVAIRLRLVDGPHHVERLVALRALDDAGPGDAP